VAAPAKPVIKLTNQDRAIAAVLPPVPVPPVPMRMAAGTPKPFDGAQGRPVAVEAPVSKPAPALKMDAVKAEPSKVDLASAVRTPRAFEKAYADRRKIPLPLALGKTNEAGGILRSRAELPHLLTGGTPGSGKSVCLKTIITSLVSAMSPQEMKLILTDPKQVE